MRPFKIVILATAIGANNRGIGQYERYLLPRLLVLLRTHGNNVLVILSKNALLSEKIDGITYIHLPSASTQSLLRLFFEQIYVPFYCYNADIFLSLESVFPLVPVGAKQKVTVVHDIHVIRHSTQPQKYPEDYSLQYKLWANLATKRSIALASRIITVSRFTAMEINSLFGVPFNKLITVPNGVDVKKFYPIEDLGAIERIKRRYSLPSSFYLFVGPYSKKKNLKLIIDAYASDNVAHDILLPVVVVGDTRRSNLYSETLTLIRSNHQEDRFIFLGTVPDDDLPALYSAAQAFLYPSLYEGFGLPALEAMACGTPVVASNTTSLPEVVGDAALLINPAEPESLIEALRKINNRDTREILIRKGLDRVKSFSWERTADLMAEAIFGYADHE
ncbi:MAG: glycosyltransferase family 1 protein [Thermodesulfovibrionales bacterium]